MSTVNIGAPLPTGSAIIGRVKIVDTGGTNEAGIDANNNMSVTIRQAANAMAIDASNNAHVGVWNGANQLAVNAGGNAAINNAQIASTAVSVNNGTTDAGTQRVTLSSDSTGQVKIATGANTIGAITQGAGAAAGTSWRFQGDFTEQASLSAGSLNADLVASTDVSAYKWLSLQINANAYSGTLTFQCSNDNTNWISLALSQPSSSTYSSVTTLTNIIYHGPVFFRYFRVRMTSYASGTAQGTLEIYTNATMTGYIGIGSNGSSVSQSGTWTVQPGNTANTTPWLATINQGSNSAVVKAASTSPALTDAALVTALSPNNTGLPVNLPTIVQSTNNKSTGSVASLAKAFTSNNQAGNSIVVVCGVGNGTAPTITDSAGNTYTSMAQVANSTAFNVAIFLAVGILTGANTVTVNNGGSTASIAMEIYEISGLIARVTAHPDQSATATGTSATAATNAISALSPNEYAFAAVGVGTAAQTITAGAGWTNDSGQQNPTTPAGLFSFVSMSQFMESLDPVTPSATFTSEPWAIVVASFRPVILGIQGTVKEASVANATLTSVASSASSVTLWASNPQARGRMATNDSTAILYLAFGPTATTSAYTVQIPASGYYELPGPLFTGVVSGIWASANGNARLTETY